MTVQPITQTAIPLSRADIAQVMPNMRAARTFEAMQRDNSEVIDTLNGAVNALNAVQAAPVVTADATSAFSAEHVLTGNQDIGVLITDGLASLSLKPTTISAGGYGDASHLVIVTFDANGRATGASQTALVSDNVTEGATNLFFTQARARASLSGAGGVTYNGATGAISLDTSSTRNTDHAAVSINAGTGLTGGGDLTATRTLGLATSGVTPGTYTMGAYSVTVDATGRIISIV